MAPLVEHFMMSPETGDGKLGAGFSERGGGTFGSGSSPYEGTGLAPGGVVGGGGDVITPLNVRDPSALVMGPGATQQAPATPVAAPAAPPTDGKWNDAIAAGKAAASAATKRASLPVPKIPLSAAGLRGLGAAAGGSGPSSTLAPISAGNVPNKAAGGDSTGNVRGGGVKGVARGPGSGSSGSMEALKKAAAAAGTDFNRTGSAASALESAASRNMGEGTGGSAGAGGGGGKEDKTRAPAKTRA